jgi:hypothetical protein
MHGPRRPNCSPGHRCHDNDDPASTHPRDKVGSFNQSSDTDTRDGPQHSHSRQKTPRQYGTQTSRRHVQSRQHNMAQHRSHSGRHRPSILSTALPHMHPREAKPRQQTHMGKKATTAATTTRGKLTTRRVNPCNNSQRLRRGGLRNRRGHQLRQRRPNQPRQSRRVHIVPGIPRHPQQVHLRLPNQDVQRRHLPVLPRQGAQLLQEPRIQTPHTAQRLLHNISLNQGDRVLRIQRLHTSSELGTIPTVADLRGTRHPNNSHKCQRKYARTRLVTRGHLVLRPLPLDSPPQLLTTQRTQRHTSPPPDLLCFPLQKHEQLWLFDVKNDIGFYMGDADCIKGGSLVYMPYTHATLVRGNGHRILISDIQLLQWYSKRRDIRRNPLPSSTQRTRS